MASLFLVEIVRVNPLLQILRRLIVHGLLDGLTLEHVLQIVSVKQQGFDVLFFFGLLFLPFLVWDISLTGHYGFSAT